MLQDAMEDEGYSVLTALNGDEAVQKAGEEPDLILLDVMMPGPDGFEVCRMIRDYVTCPIIFLSARQNEVDRIKGLAIGGDDYVVKPFSLRELKARIQAHLRRERRATTGSHRVRLRFGELTVDLKGREVLFRDQPVPLTKREFDIIELLALHPGQVFSKEQMYEKIWGYDATGDTTNITEHVKKIRAKLSTVDPIRDYISTVWGVGYKWERIG